MTAPNRLADLPRDLTQLVVIMRSKLDRLCVAEYEHACGLPKARVPGRSVFEIKVRGLAIKRLREKLEQEITQMGFDPYEGHIVDG